LPTTHKRNAGQHPENKACKQQTSSRFQQKVTCKPNPHSAYTNRWAQVEKKKNQ